MAKSLSRTLRPSFFGVAAAAALTAFSSTDVAMTPRARKAATAAGRLSASMSPVTALPPARPLYANTAIRVLPLRQRDSEDLLDRRGPFDHLHQPGLPKGLHSFPLGLLADVGGRRIL